MKYSYLLVSVGALAMAACAHVQAADAPGFQLAITVDDLSAHGSLPPGVTRQQVADSFLSAFKAHKVPEAYGFINGVQLEREPDSRGVMTAWRAAGYPLGNHGYTHMNSGQSTAAAFEGDIAGNEALLGELMAGQDWHWLRFPFLVAGSDQTHAEIMNYVTSHGYKVADVSMSFNDWAYTDTYARCMAKGDTATVEALKTRYMNDVRASVKRSRVMSQKVYGREIPQVLLIHIGAFTAQMLPQVLDVFEAEGAHYVTLAQAESDGAYDESGPKAGQGTLIERTAQEKGVNVWTPDIPTLSDTNEIAAMCK